MEKNDILDKSHHGGIKNHSTITAITQIYDYLYKYDDIGTTSVILATDLSACYDSIDTKILLDKLEHYGVRGDWNKLFASYLTDRKQFVRLDQANSILRNSPNCSIVQGSRLSGALYNTYCNEVPRLPRLINTEIYHKLVSKDKLNIKHISHHVVNFIDDSSNIIGFRDHDKVKHYLEQYYKLLYNYYNINKLKLNNDKNKLVIINKPRLNNHFKNFTFRAGGEIVKTVSKIKILGTWIQCDLKLDAEINKLSSCLHNRINNLNKIKKYTDFKTRLNFMNSFVIGKLNYMLPIYNIAPNYIKNKLHKILMKAARGAIGNYCYKKSITHILGQCKWVSINNMIVYSSFIFINKIIKNNKPKSILNIYKTQRFLRHKSDISLKNIPKNSKYSKFFIQEHTHTYNTIPVEIREKSNNTFKREIRVWIKSVLNDTND